MTATQHGWFFQTSPVNLTIFPPARISPAALNGSATYKMVEMMKQTKMEGDLGFMSGLDPADVQKELMYTAGVEEASSQLGGLVQFAGVDPSNPFVREEVIAV